MKRFVVCLLLMICFGCIAFAQETDKALAKAASNGRRVASQITVNGNVHVQAVLIPWVDARRIFGREIANNYAVIELNVGNKSPDAALIIHGVFIDYTNWPLSGATRTPLDSGSDGFQASTSPNHVASEEYRVVRGQLLDAQNSTWRNRILRWLTLAGNLAGAYTFSINEEGIVKGIAAATGVGIPGVATAWPDTTIEQLNRVSDFGFQTNKVISKQGAEVIVCFFPIDRFLTPGFKKLFLKSPALFFAPGLMLVDRSVQGDVENALGKDLGFPFPLDDLRGRLPCYGPVTKFLERGIRPKAGLHGCLSEFGLAERTDKDAKPGDVTVTNFDVFKRFMAIDFIHNVSLNKVTVTVDGVMSVDVTAVAGRIGDVDFEKVTNCGDETTQCFWANMAAAGGVRKGTISGSYLTGASVAIDEANDRGISEVNTISEGSTDQELHFSFKLSSAIPPQAKLNFTVSKSQPASGGGEAKTLESVPYEYAVKYSPTAPVITNVKQEDTKLTVKGSGFFDLPLVVKLHPRGPIPGDDVEVTPTSVSSDGRQLVVTIPDGIQPAGCWDVQVQVGEPSSSHSNTFVIKPSPTLDNATRDTDRNRVILTGDDLIDTTACGGPVISFQLMKDGSDTITVTAWLSTPATRQAAFVLPKAAKEGAGWTVHVLIDGKDVSNVALQ